MLDEEVGDPEDTLAPGGLAAPTFIFTRTTGFSTYVVRAVAALVGGGQGGVCLPRWWWPTAGSTFRGEVPRGSSPLCGCSRDTPWSGGCFTRGEGAGETWRSGSGTSSFGLHRIGHPGDSDILFSADGRRGVVDGGGGEGPPLQSGTEGHGTLSPWDIRGTLAGGGALVRKGFSTHSYGDGTSPHIPPLPMADLPTPCRGGSFFRQSLAGGPGPSRSAAERRVPRTHPGQGGDATP